MTRDEHGLDVDAPLVDRPLSRAEAAALLREHLKPDAPRPGLRQLCIPDIDRLTPEQLRVAVEHVLLCQRPHQPHGAVDAERRAVGSDDAAPNPEHTEGLGAAVLGVGHTEASSERLGGDRIQHPQRSHVFALPPMRVAVQVVEVSPIRPIDSQPVTTAQINVVLKVDLAFEGE